MWLVISWFVGSAALAGDTYTLQVQRDGVNATRPGDLACAVF